MVMSIGYIGSFGFDQFGETDTNYPTILPDPAHPGYFYTTGRPNPNFGAIRENFSNRNSAYNGLLVSVEKRYANHLQVTGNYTWSHLFSSTEGFYGVSEPSNPFNLRASTRGPAAEDVGTSPISDSRWIRDNRFHFNHFLSSVLNNWAFSLIGTAQSGRPYPISTGDSILAANTSLPFGAESTQTPNVMPDGSLSTAGIGGAGGPNHTISPGRRPALCSPRLCRRTRSLAPAGASTSGPIDMIQPS